MPCLSTSDIQIGGHLSNSDAQSEFDFFKSIKRQENNGRHKGYCL